jgi:hypothetical protein
MRAIVGIALLYCWTISHDERRRLSAVRLDPKTVFQKVPLTAPATATVTATATSYPAPLARPIMHTFYEPTANIWGDRKGTGMTDQADSALLQLWTDEWAHMGWEPVILSLHDAKKHSRFHEYYQRVQQIPLRGLDGSTVANQEYNRFCYLRWLAMAAATAATNTTTATNGGFFMSDYDVLPIRPVVDDASIIDPKFTVYSTGKEGRGVPCLMSGSSAEWERMAWLLLDNAMQHLDHYNWVDMLALMDLVGEYIPQKTVLEATALLTGQPWTGIECDLLRDRTAIHFSHYSIHHGVTRAGEDVLDRPTIAQHVLQVFHTTCETTV